MKNATSRTRLDQRNFRIEITNRNSRNRIDQRNFRRQFEKSNRSRRIRNSRHLNREVELREVEFDDRFREVE